MPRRPQKRTAERPGQQPQSLIAINPLVGPGNPPHRHPPCPKTDQSRQHHCMVSLATCASSRRSESAHQTKYATVMLMFVAALAVVAGPVAKLLYGSEPYKVAGHLKSAKSCDAS